MFNYLLLFNKKMRGNDKSATVTINLQNSNTNSISSWGNDVEEIKIKDSKMPIPPGAEGTTNPTDQARENKEIQQNKSR